MSEITGTYLYTFDQVVFVRVSSTSEYGTSDPLSIIDGAKSRSVPNQVSNLVINPYSDTSITITWTALTGSTTGNSAITAYAIYWNDGVTADNADKLVTEALLSPTTYTFTNIDGGKTYKFAVKAKNIYGYGTLSSEAQIDAIDVPAKMAIPTVALSAVSPFTSVVITWTAPNYHYSPITDYDVQFQKLDGTFTPYTAQCPGTDESLVTCTVDMLGLKTLTSLAVDSLIRVKVRAKNGKDYGSYSEVNSAG